MGDMCYYGFRTQKLPETKKFRVEELTSKNGRYWEYCVDNMGECGNTIDFVPSKCGLNMMGKNMENLQNIDGLEHHPGTFPRKILAYNPFPGPCHVNPGLLKRG